MWELDGRSEEAGWDEQGDADLRMSGDGMDKESPDRELREGEVWNLLSGGKGVKGGRREEFCGTGSQ